MHRDGPRLDVRSDAHLLGRADQHRDVPGAGGGEQPALLGVVFGFVDVADLVAGHAEAGELIAQLVIRVPAVAGCSEVAEDELQRAGGRGALAGVGVVVGLVAMLAPDPRDPPGGDVELARAGYGLAGRQAHVERGFAAIPGDLEHVVVFGQDRPGTDLLGAARRARRRSW